MSGTWHRPIGSAVGAGQFAIHGTLRMRAVIEWLKAANFSAVARRMKLSWDEVDGIMSRAVARGLARRDACSPTRIGIDETSFQKRHEYVTVVTNLDNSSVISVMDGRKEESIAGYLGSLDETQRSAIVVAAMDMWPAYINAVKQHLPNAKIAFDRFHIAKHLGLIGIRFFSIAGARPTSPLRGGGSVRLM